MGNSSVKQSPLSLKGTARSVKLSAKAQKQTALNEKQFIKVQKWIFHTGRKSLNDIWQLSVLSLLENENPLTIKQPRKRWCIVEILSQIDRSKAEYFANQRQIILILWYLYTLDAKAKRCLLHIHFNKTLNPEINIQYMMEIFISKRSNRVFYCFSLQVVEGSETSLVLWTYCDCFANETWQ